MRKMVKMVGCSALVLSAVQVASAAQDYTAFGTAVTDEVTAAMPIVLSVTGVVLGIGAGIRFIKRFGKG